MTMRRLLAIAVLSSTCTPQVAETPTSPPGGAGQAEAYARQCIEADPTKYRGVGGSPLLPEEARALKRLDDGRWLVHVPEETPTTKPTGRDLFVGPDAALCSPAPMD
jgi:hypothetical protein